MKLVNLVVTGFRSVKGTESLLLNEKVTVFIGANDHGKSNLLAAIKCLNDENQIKEEDRNWDLSDQSKVSIEWEFDLSAAELSILKQYEINPKVKKPKPVDGGAEEEPAEAEAPEEAAFPISTNNRLIFFRDNKDNSVKVKSAPVKIGVSKEAEILKLRPQVELFESPAGNVIDQVTLAELEKPEFEFMQGIFRLAGLWDSKNSIFSQTDQTSKLLDEAGNELTTILNDQWNQGRDLVWKFEHTGNNGDTIIIKIQDPSINSRYSRPSLRSSGFRTYFLLSMITFARTKNKPNHSYLFLFDEPGTYLHPHAQLDLQRSFETIADSTQIVYTTHSIFLVNKNYPERNRVISKHKDGTKIDQKPFLKNWKSVRESLGILLSNNFLIAEKTLLVEGPSDLIYLLDTIKKLKGSKKIDIDLNDLSIVDSGTSENYLAMAKLMLSEGRSVVALLDGDKSGKELEKQLKKICASEIKAKKLQIYLLPDNKSIEDVTVDIDVLKKSIENVAKFLVDNGIRVLSDDIQIATEINKIAVDKNKTLGQTIDDVTRTWFEPQEKISKLSIALDYETISRESSLNPESEEQITNIKDLLELRGERSADAGVFEDVPN